jgi:IclR family transcriptional regulator, acetate operon repressor
LTTRRATGVQSIERVFELLETMADAGGRLGLSALAERVGLPKPTTHRILRTLTKMGYVRQESSRDYVLGPRLLRLVDLSNRLLGGWAAPYLQGVANELGESANLAMLDGDRVVEVIQVAGRHSMRLVSEVGGRALPHCTASGKVLLAQLPEDDALSIVRRTGMPRFTPSTITRSADFVAELGRVRSLGYALDDEEQELGVRCVAVALPQSSLRAAISISGPLSRMSDETVDLAVPVLAAAAHRLADDVLLVRP